MKKSNSDTIPAVIYARYSSHMQREESIAGQLRECNAYAKQNGMHIIREYVDRAISGRSDKRPAFLQMIEDSSARKFKYVICWKLDRFSRERYDNIKYKTILKRNGVKVIYARETIPDGPEGTILESLMEGLAQYYSESLSQNIKRGLTDSAMNGKALGSIPFGYTKTPDGFFALDPVTAPAAAKIFQLYADGVPAVEICAELNASGYRTAQGKLFGKSSLKRIIRNEKYKGVYSWDKIRVEGGMPAIVNEELWGKAQIMADRHHRSPAAKRDVHFLLTGKIRCGLCGSTMVGESCRSKSGKIHYYYTCFGRRKGSGCAAPRIRKADTEEFVAEILRDLVGAPQTVAEMADAVESYVAKINADRREIDALQALLKESTKKHENVMKAIEMGIITESTKSRLEELEDEISGIRAAITAAELSRPRITREQILYFLTHITDNDRRAGAEQLVDVFLNCVYFYEDHADFVLNYTKNAEPVTFTSYCSALAGECSPFGSYMDQTARKANFYAFECFLLFRVAI